MRGLMGVGSGAEIRLASPTQSVAKGVEHSQWQTVPQRSSRRGFRLLQRSSETQTAGGSSASEPLGGAKKHPGHNAEPRRLVVVSNRLGNIRDLSQAGGLAVGVADALAERGGLWLGA